MDVVHFYHAYCDGQFGMAVEEHIEALREAEFTGPVLLGLVGSESARERVWGQFQALPNAAIAATAETGYEQVTLRALQRTLPYLKGQALLYAHTKGASRPEPFNEMWRTSMTNHLIREWESARDRLIFEEVDAVGCHWLTKEEFPDTFVSIPFFGGNFWMATAEYLSTLPEISLADRWEAEAWIGRGDPKVYDLLEGWPTVEAFVRGGLKE